MVERLEFELRLVGPVNVESFQSVINRVRNFVNKPDVWEFIEEMGDDEIEEISIKLSEKFELDNKIIELIIKQEIDMFNLIEEFIDENIYDAIYRVKWNK